MTKSIRRVAFVIGTATLASLLVISPAGAQVSVTTQAYDQARTGANLAETALNPGSVNVSQFGKLFERTVDDEIYGQPLYVANVSIPGVGVRNVVYVTTVRNTVYAFDADNPAATAPIWSVSFISPPQIVTTVRTEVGQACGVYEDFAGNIGIIGTPVIDAAAGTIYFVTRTKENNNFVQRLHALDIRNGQERAGAPTTIQATVRGTGAGSDLQGNISFNAQIHNQRAALLLANGVVYIAWGSYCDTGPYHGWVMGYDGSTLQQVMVYNNTANGVGGGIWQAGSGLTADDQGNIYALAGNGSFDGNSGGTNRGTAFVKLSPGGTVLDWFAPHDWAFLNDIDGDLGQGPILLPGTNLILGGGKMGKLYLLDRNNLGGVGNGNDSQIVQSFQGSSSARMYGPPVFWDSPDRGPVIYFWAASDPLKVFQLVNGRFLTTQVAQGSTLTPSGMPGAVLSLSANGSNAGSGILWASMSNAGNANNQTQPGILRAYDASDVTRELWNSEQNSSRDRLGSFSKFSAPTVANGKVYMATFSNKLVVYGLLGGGAGNQAPLVNAGTDQIVQLPNSAQLSATVSDDGNPNPPQTVTTSWSKVSGPGAVTFGNASALVTTATFSAAGTYILRLTASDSAASSTDDVSIAVSNAAGSGTGLEGEYFNDVEGGSKFTTRALIRTDAAIDFSWAASPGPSVQADNFSVRWSGQVLAPTTGAYTFSTTSNDGVRLRLNGQLIIDNWTDHATTTQSSTPQSLVAGATYDIVLEYYDHSGPAAISLLWSYPGQGQQVIPQTQLFPAPPTNYPPVIFAGSDQRVELGTTVTLQGTAVDDGLPNPPGALTVTWSTASGREADASVVFADPHSPTTTVTFAVPEVYVLRMTATDGGLTLSDDVTVTVAANQAPLVNAGADQAITLPATATLSGAATDDGLPNPPATLGVSWSRVSGPGTVTFGTPSALTTTASFSAAGTYELRLTANDGAMSMADDVTVVVSAATTGTGLTAQYYNDPASWGFSNFFTTLALTRTDSTIDFDWAGAPAPGMQADHFSVRWRGQVAAPVSGDYTFQTVSDDGVRLWVNGQQVINNWTDHGSTTNTSATISLVSGNRYDITLEFYDRDGEGIVGLRWAYPGQTTYVTIPRLQLYPAVPPTNQAPIVNAGTDQTVAVTSATLLNGTATDDGLPAPPGAMTITWSAVSGPGAVAFGSVSALTTTASFSAVGTYVLRLTVTDGAIPVSDDITVVVMPANQPPVVNAGTDQTITLPAVATLSGTATDDGIPNPPGALTATWSRVSGPGTVTFGNASALTTTATFSAAGTNVLRLTVTDGASPVTDDVTVTVNAAPVGSGLTGQYFNDSGTTFFTTPVLTRTDPTVDFNWSTGSPATGIQTDRFSVRWTGQVMAPVTGNFNFRTVVNDGVRLWVNGQQIINNWADHSVSTTNTSAAMALVAGTRYDVILEFYERTGSALMRLQWSYPGQSSYVAIPQARLFPGVPTNQSPVVNAGADQSITLPNSATLSGTASDDGLPNPPASLTTAWTQVSGPGTVTFGTASALTTSASFSAAGTYVVRLTANDGAGPIADDITIVVAAANQVPVVNAGSDQAITLPGGVTLGGAASDDGLPNPPGALTIGWTRVSGPGTVTFGTPSALTTTASFSAPGTYVLRLSANDGAGAVTDDLTVVVTAANQPPVVNAGADQAITLPNAAALSGTATDDGLPNPPGTLTITWSRVSGPGTVTFGTPTALSSSATFSAAGTYVLRLTATDGDNPVSDDLTVVVSPANQAPVVNAGPDQSITLPSGVTLSGTATDDGLPNPPGTLAISWSRFSGPGTVTFGTPNAPGTSATFSAAGTYVLRLSANDGASTISDDLTVIVNPANQAPVVNAGADQAITLPNAAALSGTATDDGLPNPPGTLTISWSRFSGPGTVTFGTPNAPGTSATFSAAGTYVLRLSANDGANTISDDLTVTVNPANQTPVVNAGTDQAITLPNNATLNGTATDDGLPNPPGALTITWSRVSGPGTVAFGTPNTLATSASFSAAGTYVLRLTVTDGATPVSDDVSVTVTPANQAPVVNAGIDQTITLPANALLNGTATDDGLPNPPGSFSISWSRVSGPGTVTFGTPTALASTASFSTAGTYVLRLTATDGATPVSDDLTVVVNGAATVGTGLTGQYFNDPAVWGFSNFFTTLALTRVDPTVDTNWTGSPGTGVQADHFSVRWTGKVEAPVTGSYNFRTLSDDGVRLWVNGQQVINNWTDHSSATNTSAAIALVAGTRYDIRLEFYDRDGDGLIRLRWAYPGQSTYVTIPQVRLFPN